MVEMAKKNRALKMNFSQYILLMVIPFIYDVCSQTMKYKQFVVENFALSGHEYKTISNTDFRTCIKACEMERACISVNYGGSSEGLGCCTLNDCGVEDEENKGRSLVFTPGCWYHQVRPTEAAIKKAGKYGGYCTVKTPKVGDRQKPGKSCRQILHHLGRTSDGEYWIDPKSSGDPFKVFCDMTTAGGGWTLIKRTVLNSSKPLEDVIEVSDYRMISEQVENRIVVADGLAKLKQDMGFDQLRLYCRKKSVGRTFHIMTNNETRGREAVRSMIVRFYPQAKACRSFTVLPDDNSILSQNCIKWGFMGGLEANRWGSNYVGMHKSDRLYSRGVFMKGKSLHRFSCVANMYKCDDNSAALSAGDTFEIYVR